MNVRHYAISIVLIKLHNQYCFEVWWPDTTSIQTTASLAVVGEPGEIICADHLSSTGLPLIAVRTVQTISLLQASGFLLSFHSFTAVIVTTPGVSLAGWLSRAQSKEGQLGISLTALHEEALLEFSLPNKGEKSQQVSQYR
ncbi:hypothetical protein Anapl_00816 [Anas platyrhynchos]|uniref:Uncharacterized protein n=1 Tax=Anas platyrhynchos TaxID=8839 RepID=R0K812_ANAPL|nr:hypothetical protein Anapl_00816 [Anas platyrhynchos]